MNENSGYMEIRSYFEDSRYNFTQLELRDAARQAPIETFGWPIGVYLEREEYRPRPVQDGIKAEVITPREDFGGTYDYWYLRTDGSFYLLQSLFEDTREDGVIYFNTRIVRVTESLLYLARLYFHLTVDLTTPIQITIGHGGLRDRVLKAAGQGRIMLNNRKATENSIKTTLSTTVGQLESNLTKNVDKITKELFVLFDFFEVNENVLEQIVTDFVKGKVT